MQSRSTLLQLFKQLRPTHSIKAKPQVPYNRLIFHQAIRNPLSTLSALRRLPPSLAQSSSHHRLLHSTTSSLASPTVPIVDSSSAKIPLADTPKYQLTFTCKPCTNRSTHTVSRHGYEKGTVLVTCPSCKNRHVISDHLKIFSDKRMTLEDILREKGELVKRGRVGPGGDVEFWDEEGTRGAP
ncbi:MAG: hypothetical protein L6R38_003200 [Xanthoria sp. 2 TBL-2021]|nr:MAG: hypothetical protein L6R38_003200 [Xanthoria sp. 2 TBL-2021]